MTAAEILQDLSLRLRWRQAVGRLAVGAGAAAFLAALARWFGVISGGGALAVAVAGLILAALLVVAADRAGSPDPRALARHLDRVFPGLEESAELLLLDREGLSAMERLQQSRALAALPQITRAPSLPSGALHRRLALAAGLLIAAIVMGLLPAAGAERLLGWARPAGAGKADRPPGIERLTVSIEPPGYTGHAPRRGSAWDLSAEEGSRVTWRLHLNHAADRVTLETSEGDTLMLRPEAPGASTDFSGSMMASRSFLYQVILQWEAGRVRSDYHQAVVQPDEPPSVTVVTPDQRTTLAAGTAAVAPLLVLANDDYGLSGTGIVATLTSGSGEAVKFREQRLAFELTQPRGSHGLTLRKTLDLNALGLKPGDELYFYVAASDNRSPVPHETRSETIFLRIADTAKASSATFTGVALNLQPEYFRSERQIIIDTEKLLADRPRISAQEFKDRSNNIGIDQSLLRIRYGELVGDEFEEGGPVEEHPAEPAPDRDGAPKGKEDASAPFTHEHDTQDNATRLDRTVKSVLKDAISQMWSAERYLRTYDPQGALPFEYRALELIKQVQQAARVYVQRVGFEPPPLEPDKKRLTGKLTAVLSPVERWESSPVVSLPAVRAALETVSRYAAGDTPAPAEAPILERAGAELAKRAVQEPGRHLAGLGALRRLVVAAEQGRSCAACVHLVGAELWRLLPVPDPGTSTPPGEGASRLGQRYLDALRSSP